MALATSRTVHVLQTLATSERSLSLAEIVSRTGVGRASAARLLAPLLAEQIVIARGEPPRYSLGLGCWQLGIGALVQHPVVRYALPHLFEFARAHGTRVNLALPQGTDVIFVQSVDASAGRLTTPPVFVRTNMLETASGRVCAAFGGDGLPERLSGVTLARLTPHTPTAEQVIASFPRIREDGYACVDREQEIDVSGVAFPIRGRTGTAVAAIGLPYMGAFSRDFFDRLISPGLELAAAISAEMGFSPRPFLPLA